MSVLSFRGTIFIRLNVAGEQTSPTTKEISHVG